MFSISQIIISDIIWINKILDFISVWNECLYVQDFSVKMLIAEYRLFINVKIYF